jgi:nucleotide-binding universal stress UspA family protein
MYRVLVPIDGSEERAASQARAVTRLPNAADEVEAILLHVFDDDERAEQTAPTQLSAGRRAEAVLADAGVRIRTESASGDPVEEILAAAEDDGVDAHVLGGRKRSTVGTLLFGSVSQAVTLRADIPVTITGDDVTGEATYVCARCGERYYTESEVTECTSCGGVEIEQPV